VTAQEAGDRTDLADPAMWGGGAAYGGPKIMVLIFSLKISQSNYHANVRYDE